MNINKKALKITVAVVAVTAVAIGVAVGVSRNKNASVRSDTNVAASQAHSVTWASTKRSGKGGKYTVGKTGKASYPSAAPSVSSAPSVVSCSIQNLIDKSISGTSNIWNFLGSSAWINSEFNLIFTQPPAQTATTGFGVVVGQWCGPNYNWNVVAAQTGFSVPGNVFSFELTQTTSCGAPGNPCKSYNGEYNCGTGEVIIGNAQTSGTAGFHLGSVSSTSLSCPY